LLISGKKIAMPNRRHEFEELRLRGDISGLIVKLLRISHQQRFRGESFARALPLIVIYCTVMRSYAAGKLLRAAEIERELGFSHETCRRHLSRLVASRLLEREGARYRPRAETVGRRKGAPETAAAIRRAAAALSRIDPLERYEQLRLSRE
jgi:hypothetical protein